MSPFRHSFATNLLEDRYDQLSQPFARRLSWCLGHCQRACFELAASVARPWAFSDVHAWDGGPFEKLARSVSVSPTVLQSGPYRLFFFSSVRNEPVHVHAKRDRKLAKFWLAPVRLAYNYGFSDAELNRIAGIVRENEAALAKAWHDYFKRPSGDGDGQRRSGH